jgi:hypothetical protein
MFLQILVSICQTIWCHIQEAHNMSNEQLLLVFFNIIGILIVIFIVPRHEKHKQEQENLQWYAVADSRDCVRVDKNGNGLLRLWQQQLCQFNRVTMETAQAITSVYRSPYALVQVDQHQCRIHTFKNIAHKSFSCLLWVYK